MTTKEDIKKLLEKNPKFKDKLYIRGYYFTSDTVDSQNYPFYGLWNHDKILGYNVLVHNKQSYYVHKYDKDKSAIILIGHAYNPFTMQHDENEIIAELSTLKDDNFWNKFNELTGIFTLITIENSKVKFVGDNTCLQCIFYGVQNGKLYLASHTNLLGDFLDLKWDQYVKKLCEYKFFKLMGGYLPGDITQFAEIKHLIPNNFGKFDNCNDIKITRFYVPKFLKLDDAEVIERAATIIHNSMKLISVKWDKPAISVTGGCDSKTTLASTNGLYDKFMYFSYISNNSEKVDAEAAKKICDYINIQHKIYRIPNDSDAIKDIDIDRIILKWNCGGLTDNNPNDVRKRSYLYFIDDFDLDIKSHESEQGRAYYSKRFNKKTFGILPTARKCTTLYKFFFHNRKLVRDTDNVFKNFIEDYFFQDKCSPICWEDWFLWEFMLPSKNALILTCEQKFSNDISVPYNNRLLFELMMSFNLEDRINDRLNSEIRNKMNPDVDKACETVINVKHTKNRARLERLYYELHSRFPF